MEPSIKLYARPYEIDTNKVVVALLEKQVAFEFVGIRISSLPEVVSAGALPGAYAGPALVAGDCRLLGSMAICAFLEDRYPLQRLVPLALQDRALVWHVEEYFYEQLKDILFRLVTLDEGAPGVRPDASGVDGLIVNRLQPLLQFLENLKPDHRYLVSDDPSLADISLGVALMHISPHATIGDKTQDRSLFGRLSPRFPRVAAYCDDLWNRVSFRVARDLGRMAEPVFVGSDRTITNKPPWPSHTAAQR